MKDKARIKIPGFSSSGQQHPALRVVMVIIIYKTFDDLSFNGSPRYSVTSERIPKTKQI